MYICFVCFFPSIWTGFTNGLSLFTCITMTCLCTKCYQDVKTEEKREALRGHPSISSKAGMGLHPLKRANSVLVLVGWGKEDGKCHRILVSGLKSSLNSSISLSQVLWLLLSSAFPLGPMSLILCARMEFLDTSCLHYSVCASASPALRHSAEGKHLKVSLGGTSLVYRIAAFFWHLCLRNEFSDRVQ